MPHRRKRKRAWRAFKWTSTALLVVSLIDAVQLVWSIRYEGTRTIAVFDCGQGRKIGLKTDVWADPDPGCLYYEASVDGRITSPCHFVGQSAYNPNRYTYFAIACNGGSLVGVHQMSAPEYTLVIHNFATGESWPRDEGNYDYTGIDGREERRAAAEEAYEAARTGGTRIESDFIWPPLPYCCLLPFVLISTVCAWWVDLEVSIRLRRWFKRGRVSDGCCRKCQYNLTGNVSGRCPECGTPIKQDAD